MTKVFKYDIFIAYHGDDQTGSAGEAKRLCTILKRCFPTLEVYCQVYNPKCDFVNTIEYVAVSKYFMLVAKPSIPVDENKRIIKKNNGKRKWLSEEIESFKLNVRHNTDEENIAKVLYVNKGAGIVSFEDTEYLDTMLFHSENYHYEEIDNFNADIEKVSIEEIKTKLFSSSFYKSWFIAKFPKLCVNEPQKIINKEKKNKKEEQKPAKININQFSDIYNQFDDIYINKEDLVIDDPFIYTNINRIKGIKELSSDKLLINKEIKYINQNVFNDLFDIDVIYDGSIEKWCTIQFNNKYSNPMYSMRYNNSFYLLNGDKYSKLINLDLLGVDEIKNYSFIGLSFDNLIINRNTRINEYSFDSCHFNNVFFNGTLSDWLNMDFNNKNCNPKYFSDNLYILDEYNKFVLFPKIIRIPDDIKEIKPYTFINLNIVDVDLNNIESIHSNAFYLTKNLYRIKIDKRMKFIDELAFDRSSVEEILTQVSIKLKNKYIRIIKHVEESNFIFRNDYVFKIDNENNTSTIRFYYGNDTNIVINKTISCNKKTYNIVNVDYDVFVDYAKLDSISFNTKLNNYEFLNEVEISKVSICINKPETILDNIGHLDCEHIEVLDDNGEIVDDKKRRFHKIRFFVDSLSDIREYEKRFIKEVTLKEYKIDYSFFGFSSLEKIIITKDVNCFIKFSLNDKFKYTCDDYTGEKIDLYYEGNIKDWIQIAFNEDATPLVFSKNFYYKKDNEYIKLVDLKIDLPHSRISEYSFIGYKEFRKIFINKINYIDWKAFAKCDYEKFILNQFSGGFFVDDNKEIFMMSNSYDKKIFKKNIIYKYSEKKPLINKKKYWHFNDKNEPEIW